MNTNKIVSNKKIKELECRLQYSFKDDKLLRNALVHSSYVNENKNNLDSNERLEFLGDSVLSLVISTYLYDEFDYKEGILTKLRALIVCEQSLVKVAEKFELGKYLYMGKGEDMTGGRSRACILADAMEAVICAIYLDSDFNTVSSFVIRNFMDIIEAANNGGLNRDYKSMLQEMLQEHSTEVVKYEIYDENGPAHDKMYFAHAIYMEKIIGSGSGKSKKIAQKAAAQDAYQKLMG